VSTVPTVVPTAIITIAAAPTPIVFAAPKAPKVTLKGKVATIKMTAVAGASYQVTVTSVIGKKKPTVKRISTTKTTITVKGLKSKATVTFSYRYSLPTVAGVVESPASPGKKVKVK
jgi:hypothetical protein